MPERERFLARRALAAAPALAHERGGERNRGVKAAAARRTYEEVGVHGRAQRATEKFHRCRLALHTVENRGADRVLGCGHRKPSMPRRARTAPSTAAAT
jgi:hypothetical protein